MINTWLQPPACNNRPCTLRSAEWTRSCKQRGLFHLLQLWNIFIDPTLNNLLLSMNSRFMTAHSGGYGWTERQTDRQTNGGTAACVSIDVPTYLVSTGWISSIVRFIALAKHIGNVTMRRRYSRLRYNNGARVTWWTLPQVAAMLV